MSSQLPQTLVTPAASEQQATIAYGRMDFFSVIFRATAGELLKIRRRAMSKVLGIIAFITMLLTFLILSLPALISSAERASNPLAAQNFESSVAILHLPEALNISGSLTMYFGSIFIMILAGTIVGGEYGAGTIRIMLTRGPSRVQFLLSKMLALLVCTLVTVVGMLLVGILTGTVLSLLLGVPTPFNTLDGTWITHALLYAAVLVLHLFSYSLLAVALATLGKSTAAGIAGATIWWFLDAFSVLSNILNALGNLITNAFGDLLKAIPDYLLGSNLAVLAQNQAAYMYNSPSTNTISDLHAILVVTVYLVCFIAITCWVQLARDITE